MEEQSELLARLLASCKDIDELATLMLFSNGVLQSSLAEQVLVAEDATLFHLSDVIRIAPELTERAWVKILGMKPTDYILIHYIASLPEMSELVIAELTARHPKLHPQAEQVPAN